MAGIYFFDDFALDRKISVERRYYKARKHSTEPFVGKRGRVGYPTLLWNPEMEKYHLWHSVVTSPEMDDTILALAESDDAKKWTKADNCGSQDPLAAKIPNCVFSGGGSVHGAAVCRDRHEKDPKHRYKLAGSVRADNASFEETYSTIATSPDGINWNMSEGFGRWGEIKSDTYNNLFYNPVRKTYQIIHRAACADRRIHCIQSNDLSNWSPPELLAHPDPFDPPCCQLYGMPVSVFDGIFIAMLWIYNTDMYDPVPHRMAGYTSTELVYSYDGFHWNRTHQNLIDLPDYPEYGSASVYATNIACDKAGENWLIPATMTKTPHGDYLDKNGELLLWGTPEFHQNMGGINEIDSAVYAIETLKIRPDGFVGLYSYGAFDNSNLLFKAIELLGDNLSLNVNATLGKVWFQICDGSTKPIPGFTFEDCIPFQGDALACRPTWREHDLSELKGRQIRLELRMHAATLYAVHGDFRPHHGASPQANYGNPEPQ